LKKYLFPMLLACAAILATSQAQAWEATAVGSDDSSYMAYGEDGPEEAKAAALKGCSEDHNGCRLVAVPANRLAVVFAVGDGGWGHSANVDPETAMRQALAECTRSAKHCHVANAVWDQGTIWSALAAGKSAVFADVGQSKADAEMAALAGCRKLDESPTSCAVDGSNSIEGHVFYEMAGAGDLVWFGRGRTREDARSDAMANCSKASTNGASCKIVDKEEMETHAPTPAPASMQKVLAEVAKTRKAAQAREVRSETTSRNVVTCYNQCVNGDCIRTFTNGRKERWQAPRVFDPSSGDWTWDTSSCGA
jgi:hypothetical protein